MTFDVVTMRRLTAAARLHLARLDAAVMQGDQRVAGEAVTAAQDALLEARIMWAKMPRAPQKKGRRRPLSAAPEVPT